MATTGCISEVEEFSLRSQGKEILEVEEFSLCSQGKEILVNTDRGSCSLTPSSLGLQIFHIRGNYYNQVVAEISKDLVWLRWFNIEQNNLGSLGSLKHLRVLEFYENRFSKHHLQELWETDSNAPVQLRELVISECYNFQRFPKSIGCLRDLKIIVLTNKFWNEMESLPEEFCRLQSLEHLELSMCRELSSLPRNFGHLRNLRHLNLSNSENLRSLPVSFKKLTLLQHLNLQGCSKLTLESDILENMTKLEYLNLSDCKELEEMPRHITKQASLTKLYLGGISKLKEMPMNITQLSKLRVMEIGSELLTCLPTSLGDLSSLTTLLINECPKLKCLPDSLGRLNLLEYLEIANSGVKSLPKSVRQLNNLQRLLIFECPTSQLNLRAGSFSSSLCNLKLISLSRTEVSKISIPQDCCPGLETIFIDYNKHLTEIEVLPSAVNDIRLSECKILRSTRGVESLVNIQSLIITGCPELDALPNFAQFCSLRIFRLQGCYRVKKIQGLEHCRALEELTAETRWEEAGIESLERMERLRIVKLTAISRSAVEGCIQSMKKWPDEIIICTRAAPDAVSLLNCALSNLSITDSNINSDTHGTLLCCVVNCESPKMNLFLMGDNMLMSSTDVEKGKWIWIALFQQGSRWHTTKEYRIDASPSAFSSPEDTTEEYHIDESSSGISSLEDTAEELTFTVRTTKLVIGGRTLIVPFPDPSEWDTSEVTVSTSPSYEMESDFVLMGEVERLVRTFICLFMVCTN